MAALFDPAILVVVVASAVFVALVVISVFVLRWLILHHDPELSARSPRQPSTPRRGNRRACLT